MRFGLTALALIFALGCSSDPDATPDAGQPDATVVYDSGTAPDSGLSDVDRGDAGRLDGGFSDPSIIRAGREQVNRLRTYLVIYRGTQTSTLPPVFVLHRGPGTSHEYLPEHLTALREGRDVIFYDMRATGRTSVGDGTSSSTVTTDQHVRDLGDLIDYVGALPDGIDVDQVDLVGHEYGAAVAARYAAQNPARVSKLVLITPFPADIRDHARYRAEVEGRLSGPARERYYAIINRPECYGDLYDCYLEVWNILGPLHMCAETQDTFAELDFDYGSPITERRYIDRDLRNTSYDWRPELPRITADTTIISGPCDAIPVSTSTTYAGLIGGSTHVVLDGTGQFPMVEDKPAFEAALRTALIHP